MLIRGGDSQRNNISMDLTLFLHRVRNTHYNAFFMTQGVITYHGDWSYYGGAGFTPSNEKIVVIVGIQHTGLFREKADIEKVVVL